MKLHSLKANTGARSKRYRVGRGMAQGRGKQAGKGQSGQNKRKGHRPGFEGGQNPWFRRLPKIGFNNFSHVEYQIVSLKKLDEKFKNGDKVDLEILKQKNIIKSNKLPIKILANGKITKKLTVKVNKISATAKSAIEKAGGKVELV